MNNQIQHEMAVNWKFFRAFRNFPFVLGLVVLALGTGPLVVFGLLQELGYFPGNNGLGFGLLFFFSIWPALALIIGGVAVAVKRVDGPRGKRAA